MPNKAAAAYLYPAVLTYSALVFGGWTVRGFLVLEAKRREICGEDDEGDNETCDEDEVSRQAALFLTWVGIASSLPPIFMAGPLGRLADSAGRRYPASLACSLRSYQLCVVLRLPWTFQYRGLFRLLLFKGSLGLSRYFLCRLHRT
jgi:hypothetical protein